MAERTEERPISAESVNAIIYSYQIHHSVIALFTKYTLDMIFSKLNNSEPTAESAVKMQGDERTSGNYAGGGISAPMY